MNRRSLVTGIAVSALGAGALTVRHALAAGKPERFEVEKTAAQWRAQLSPDAFDVLRQEGTEAPGTSPLLAEHRRGDFACDGCDLPVFASATKFESGTGWPSFYAPLPRAVETRTDLSLGLPRTEVHCRRCGGHLGHVFDDGPRPTGLRYCMNGVALRFHPAAHA